jgi:aspartate/methionine/tyrosine aminotransferase
MTGWRLGWLVLPPALVPAVEKLAQNLFICASSIAQQRRAGLLRPESIAEYERRREFRRGATSWCRRSTRWACRAGAARRRVLRLVRLQRFAADSWDFCFDMMERAHVALTPGRDFGPHACPLPPPHLPWMKR